ncbi:MAG TPA: ATP-binding protein, partial [Elusimicrobiota bacterium]|nr:ATP-binding protein [Elusimicrobiota bacterium]
RGEELEVQLDVLPIKAPLDRRRRYLVLFSTQPKPLPAGTYGGRTQARQLEFQQLREELDSAKEYVRWVSREQETADAERRSTSDETASAVEEFHSLNEELEAAKEELQAANEELTTANEDLSRRIEGLRASNDELLELVASVRIPIVLLDKDLNIRRFTPEAEIALDLRPGDAGRPLTDLALPIPIPELKKEVGKVLHGQPAAELEIRSRQGRLYSLWIRPYQSGDRTLKGVSLSLIDFTERRRRLLAVQSSWDYAEAGLDAFKVLLVVLDSSLKIIRANKRFHETFKTTAAAACGRTLPQLGKGMWNAQPIRERLHDLCRDETPFTDFECEFDIPSRGVRTLVISGRVVAGGPGEAKSLLIAAEDVTQRKQAAEAAALRKSEVRQRDFVANVSHELMTPITAIKGYSEALVAGALEIPGKRLKFTQIIEKHADRLTQLVEDLLQLSTSEAGQKKAVDTVPLAAQLQKLLMGLAPMARKRGISVRVKVAADLKVHVNKSELNQVLQNLVANAVKYNRSKGRITIAAGVVGKRILVSVADTGIGVPKEDLTRIFDRFHRAANARSMTERGTGLGLSIVKSILAAHGCRIWAESTPGKGTTFFFTLPKA